MGIFQLRIVVNSEYETLLKVHMQKFLSVSKAKMALQADQITMHHKQKEKQTILL